MRPALTTILDQTKDARDEPEHIHFKTKILNFITSKNRSLSYVIAYTPTPKLSYIFLC